MKINKIILIISIIIFVFLVFNLEILPEGVAFLLYFLFLLPIGYLGYDICFMSGASCVPDVVPTIVYFIGPIFFGLIFIPVTYYILSFFSRIISGLMHRDFSDKVFSFKYYKKLIIFLICVLVLVTLSYLNQIVETENIKKEMKRTTAPEYVLREYYDFYIKYLNRIPDSVDEYGNSILNDPSLGNRFVTENIVNRFNELKLQYPDGVPFNPFICAQDFPEDTSNSIFKEISNNGNFAKFEVYLFERPFIVTLVKNYDGDWVTTDVYGNKYDVWKIDDINCNR